MIISFHRVISPFVSLNKSHVLVPRASSWWFYTRKICPFTTRSI